MFEIIAVFLAATIAGIVGGLLPGVGALVVMITAFPILIQLDPVNIILFFVVMVSLDQYFNNTSAILMGMPGVSTSIPTVIEGHTMFRRGEGDRAIMFSAISSWLCSAFGILFILFCIPILFLLYEIWNTTVQAIIFAFTFISIVLFSTNKIWINALLFGAGLFLGWIGYDESYNTHNLTFNWPPIYEGLPVMCVIVSMFVFPKFMNNYLTDKRAVEWPMLSLSGYIKSFSEIKKYTVTLIRSGFIGSLGGFVPGLSYSASSLFSYQVEKFIRGKKYKEGDTRCLIASEGSNNAGAFTQLMPLLFLGIPITASEALVYNMLEMKGVPLTIEWFQSTFLIVTVCFFLSSTIGLFVAGKYINMFSFLDGISVGKLYLFIASFLVIMIWWLGNVTLSGWDNLIITGILSLFGLLLIRLETSPLIFGFLLHDTIFFVCKRLSIMYF